MVMKVRACVCDGVEVCRCLLCLDDLNGDGLIDYEGVCVCVGGGL